MEGFMAERVESLRYHAMVELDLLLMATRRHDVEEKRMR
jgi:hypothetical protein